MADALAATTAHPYDDLEGRSTVLIDVSRRPDLARKYGVAVVSTIVAVHPDGTFVERLAP
jgi:hypothetical protein